MVMGLVCLIFFKQYQHINVNNDLDFQAVFPMWRGSSYILFYFWLLGINILLFESLNIDYKLIMQMDTNYIPRSSSILISVSFFTSIYIILFMIYLLQKSSILPTTISYHYSGITWLLYLIFLLLPLPILAYKCRLYFVRLLLSVIFSPCIEITFLMIWITQQIVSFNQPVSDFVYTVCKYVNFQSDCSVVPLISMIILAVFFFYRMIQNFKMGWQTNSPLFSGPYTGFLRAFLSMNAVIAAYVYKINNSTGTLIYWLFFAIVSTFWAWFVDIKFDWGLFSNQQGCRILRPKLILPNLKPLYYFLIILNLLLRSAWILTISPQIVKKLEILPFIFIMILSYLQLFRRNIWNFFRIQFEHTRNCQKFQSIINYSKIQQKVKQKCCLYFVQTLLQNMDKKLNEIRKKQQLQKLIQLLKNKSQYKQILLKQQKQIYSQKINKLNYQLSNNFKQFIKKIN